MKSILKTILPRQANNDYRGGWLPLCGFWLILAKQLLRAFVHLFTPDSRKNSIGA
jgi:hypothetical protein